MILQKKNVLTAQLKGLVLMDQNVLNANQINTGMLVHKYVQNVVLEECIVHKKSFVSVLLLRSLRVLLVFNAIFLNISTIKNNNV